MIFCVCGSIKQEGVCTNSKCKTLKIKRRVDLDFNPDKHYKKDKNKYIDKQTGTVYYIRGEK